MSAGGACSRFKQNAWKKELCSNCYRPKEEHAEAPKPPLVHLPLLEPSQGILVHVKSKKKVKKKSVSFTKEESEVIGYGGAESSSEEEEDDYDWEDSKEDEREVVGEEEKALERLTKSNTDFNSVLGNLNTPGILPLGKQQKQTLQVTVQPFSMSDSRKPVVNKLLEELPLITTKTDPPIKDIKNENESVNEEEKKQPMPLMKTIIIENKPQKEEPRGNPEGRKTQITRGNVITKNQGEQVKNKLYIQNVMNGKCDSKRTVTQLKDEKKTEPDINKIIINTGPNIEDKNNRNLQQSLENKLVNGCVKESNEVTVKVLKLVGDGLAESREMAGEPDGKADSDEPETPLTPPPRSSFLHRESTLFKEIPIQKDVSLIQDSTKEAPVIRELIPHKDLSPQRESPPQVVAVEPRILPSTPVLPTTPPPIPASPPPSCSPPPTPSPPMTPLQPFPSSSSPPASPPARSKRPAPKPPAPEPTPRRRGSLGEGSDKKKTRMRQTLRKLLRFGSREEEVKTPEEEGIPRPRPQIIHPLDLNKSAVQVLPPTSIDKNSTEIYASTASIASYSVGRPSKPPPPPRSESLNLMERLRPSPNSENNVYANLEGRCGITPVKPQRTGSMRDSTSPITKDSSTKDKEVPKQCTFQTDNDNVYECVGVSSAPECDMSLPPYYGSETESDIYYPYISFQNGESKTKIKRKERGIVHSTLEENYGAVVVANHETLTHLLQQMSSKRPEIPKEIQETEMRLNLFNLNDEDLIKVGKFCFINSKLKDLPVTLVLGPAELAIPEIMGPLSQFKTALPSKYADTDFNNGIVTVLSRKRIERLSVYARKLEKSAESVREGVHILLQVVKHLLASKGKVNTDNFIVFTSENNPCAAYLPSTEESVNTDDCLREMCKRLIGSLPLGRVLEKCNVAETESVLEVWLWGPASPLALPSLARWLDLERANFLNSLICNRNSIVDREQLAFLVRSTPKSIAHSSQIIEHNAS